MGIAASEGTPREGTFHPRRVSTYVRAMQYASNVDHVTGLFRVDFGTPEVADPDWLVVAYTTTSGLAETLTLANQTLTGTGSLAPYGRNVTVDADAACARVATVTGKDYLGQTMTETITANGTTLVSGVKAFAWIDSIAISAVADAADIFFGFGDVLGLPYKAHDQVGAEVADGVTVSVGTFVAGIATDPQTAATADPRGTYNPTTTLDGAAHVLATFMADANVNASGNGGLHGIAQA